MNSVRPPRRARLAAAILWAPVPAPLGAGPTAATPRRLLVKTILGRTF